MIRTVAVTALVAIGLATPARAELGAPIATGELGCVAGVAGTLTSTTAVTGGHLGPIAEVTGTSPAGGPGSVNLPSNRGPSGYQEDTYFPGTPVRYWAQLDTLLDGERQTLESDCGELAAGSFHAAVRVFDRPSTPVTFTGSRNHPESHLGFAVPAAGRYVAEVDPGEPGLRVALESFTVQEGDWIEPGEARSATFDSPGVLELGTLAAGGHALTTRASGWSGAAALRLWRVTIRQVPETPVVVVAQPVDRTTAAPNDGPRPGPEPQQGTTTDAPRTVADRTRPRFVLRVRRTGAVHRVRISGLSERSRVRVIVRAGSYRRVVRRTLDRGWALSLRIRAHGRKVRVSVLARDAAGNGRLLRRSTR